MALAEAAFTGKFFAEQYRWRDERLRAVYPAVINGIIGGQDQFQTSLCETIASVLVPAEAAHPRIDEHLAPGSELLDDPLQRWLLQQTPELVLRRIHLTAHLHRVPSIGEYRCLVCKHHGHTRRAAEPGQPAQTLVVRRNVFTEIFIGPRHTKGIYTAL